MIGRSAPGRVRLFFAIVMIASTACIPRLRPLRGSPVPAVLPATTTRPGHTQVVFEWELEDPDMLTRGEGVARIAYPDSARLDFFLAGGFGGGAAVLIGDSLRLPSMDFVRRLIPPPPMLWASLGRFAVPALPDTVARAQPPLLHADMGRPTEWRVTFRNDSLVRVERIRDSRIVEWMNRPTSDSVRYRSETGRRSLTLKITKTFEVPPFDATIWRFGQ